MDGSVGLDHRGSVAIGIVDLGLQRRRRITAKVPNCRELQRMAGEFGVVVVPEQVPRSEVLQEAPIGLARCRVVARWMKGHKAECN